MGAYTSRKHGKNEPHSFVHCGSFDHHDLQSLNDYKFFFCLTTAILKFWGHVTHHWKGILKTFSNGILKAPNFLEIQLVDPKKQICSRLTSAYHGGQKNRNGQTTAILFYHVFLLVIIEVNLFLNSTTLW